MKDTGVGMDTFQCTNPGHTAIHFTYLQERPMCLFLRGSTVFTILPHTIHVDRVIEQEALLEVQALRLEELVAQINELQGQEQEVRQHWLSKLCLSVLPRTYYVHIHLILPDCYM